MSMPDTNTGTTTSSSEADIATQLKALMASHFAVSIDQVTPESRIFEDFGADSLDMAELILMLEDKFSVKVSEHDVLYLQTVGEILEYAAKLASGAKVGSVKPAAAKLVPDIADAS